MRICGIDEAGKGAVIGDLVVAGVALDSSQEWMLESWGVKDSKLLTRASRLRIYSILVRNLEYSSIHLTPSQIDSLRTRSNLNHILADCYVELIERLDPELVYLDCPSPNIPRYLEMIQGKLRKRITIIAQHKAELKYKSVAAASIIAKVERDASILELEHRIGAKIGSGYPSDPVTIKFIRDHGIDPEIMRISWETIRRFEAGVSSK